MDDRITIIENPIEEDYDVIRKKYWNKWVAIHYPHHLSTYVRGTVVSYADANDDFELKWLMQDHLCETYGGGMVTCFIDEDMEEGYVIFRDVQ